MKRWSSTQVLRAGEYVYAALTLFALTQGPIFLVWKSSAARISELPSPSIAHVHFATFLALQAPGIAVFIRRVKTEWFSPRTNLALAALVAWLGATTMWSTFARESFPQSVSLVATTIFGSYLSLRFSTREFWIVLSIGMFSGVGLSWIAVMRLWDGAVNFQYDYWVGIYFNRNSLAPVAVTALIGAAYLLLTRPPIHRRSLLLHGLLLLPVCGLCSLAIIEIWMSESRTSPAALVSGILIMLLGLALRWMFVRIRALKRLDRYSFLIALLVALASILLYVRNIGGLTGIVVRLPMLNPREVLWEYSWSGFLQKPWHGWGWMAAWRTPEFFNSPASTWASTWRSEWSHNSYFDLLLGGGVVAVALFATFLLSALVKRDSETWRNYEFRALTISFVLAAATQESFFIGSHFLWAVLVVVAVGPSCGASSIEEQKAE